MSIGLTTRAEMAWSVTGSALLRPLEREPKAENPTEAPGAPDRAGARQETLSSWAPKKPRDHRAEGNRDGAEAGLTEIRSARVGKWRRVELARATVSVAEVLFRSRNVHADRRRNAGHQRDRGEVGPVLDRLEERSRDTTRARKVTTGMSMPAVMPSVA